MAETGKTAQQRSRVLEKNQESPSRLSLSALVRDQMLLDRRCRFRTRVEAFNRIRSDYLELPGLRLTAAQAARLWGLEPDLASNLLEEMVARKLLILWGDQYCLR